MWYGYGNAVALVPTTRFSWGRLRWFANLGCFVTIHVCLYLFMRIFTLVEYINIE